MNEFRYKWPCSLLPQDSCIDCFDWEDFWPHSLPSLIFFHTEASFPFLREMFAFPSQLIPQLLFTFTESGTPILW